MGSEMTYINSYFQWATTACFATGTVGGGTPLNALAQNFLGGNFSSCANDAIRLNGGNATVIGTGFQNGSFSNGVPTQAGWDINILQSVFDHSVFLNVRTESAKRCLSSSVRRKAAGIRFGSNTVSPASDIAEASRTLSNSGTRVRFIGSTTYTTASPRGDTDR